MSKYFKTSDGEEFYTENHAQSHARSLKDKTLIPPGFVVVEDEDEVAALVAVNFSKMTKKQLIDFAVSKGIEVDEKATNTVIIAGIEAEIAKALEIVGEQDLTPKTEE